MGAFLTDLTAVAILNVLQLWGIVIVAVLQWRTHKSVKNGNGGPSDRVRPYIHPPADELAQRRRSRRRGKRD